MYGTKYLIQFNSSEHNRPVAVRIMKDGYVGAIKKLSCTSKVLLNWPEADCIRGSSLTMELQADTDGELREMYTTDRSMYQVEVIISGVGVWKGYVLPELYSEPYVRAPYDVTVTASDQLGILKDIAYEPAYERLSLLGIIKRILANTNLELNIHVFCEFGYAGKSTGMLDFSYLDDATFEGDNCYAALEKLLKTINARIMQKGERWIIYRDKDIYSSGRVYNWGTLSQTSTGLMPSSDFGAVSKTKNYVISNMTYEIQPAYKGQRSSLEYLQRSSMLVNSDMQKILADSWLTNNSADVTKMPTATNDYIEFGNINFNVVPYFYQDIPNMSEDSGEYDIDVTCAIAQLYTSYQDYGYGLSVYLYGLKNGRIVKKYIRGKWTDNISIELGMDITLKQYTSIPSSKGTYQKATLKMNGIPDGIDTLRIKIENNSFVQEADPGGLVVVGYLPVLVGSVYMYRDTLVIKSVNTEYTLNESASKNAQDIVVAYGDALSLDNVKYTLINYLTLADGTPTGPNWKYRNLAGMNFYNMMVNDSINCNKFLREKLSGVVSSYDVLGSGRLMLKQSTLPDEDYEIMSETYSLYNDECSIAVTKINNTYDAYSFANTFNGFKSNNQNTIKRK